MDDSSWSDFLSYGGSQPACCRGDGHHGAAKKLHGGSKSGATWESPGPADFVPGCAAGTESSAVGRERHRGGESLAHAGLPAERARGAHSCTRSERAAILGGEPGRYRTGATERQARSGGRRSAWTGAKRHREPDARGKPRRIHTRSPVPAAQPRRVYAAVSRIVDGPDDTDGDRRAARLSGSLRRPPHLARARFLSLGRWQASRIDGLHLAEWRLPEHLQTRLPGN